MSMRRLAHTVLLFATVAASACGTPAPHQAASGADAPPMRAAAPVAQSAAPAGTNASVPQAPQAKSVTVNAFAPPDSFGGNWTYFRETGHYVAGGFKQHFDANGGIAAFGYPITEELVEDGWTVQYFQRARLEYHAENPAAPVQRALLGDMLLKRYGAQNDTRGLSRATTDAPLPDGARTFPETGTWTAPPFLQFFDRNGGIDAFGFPVASPRDGVQWFQRARLEVNGGAVQAALIGDEYTDVEGLADMRTRAQPPRLARVDLPRIIDMLDVLAAPSSTEQVTRLPADTQVRVSGEQVGAAGEGWYAIRLWNAVEGFVPRDRLAFTPAPDKPVGADSAPWKPPRPPAQGPFALQAQGTLAGATDYVAAPDGPAAGRTQRGGRVSVTAWATDAQGRVWFQFQGADGAGWVLATALPLDLPAPAAAGDPRLSVVSGKGMWFTYDTLRQTPATNLVAAARANGFTFLAPEVGTSRRGYWAGADLDALLPIAHAAGLKVVPWVYPWLADVPGDFQLALAAARHVAPSGDRVDALGIDVEENLDEAANRTYGQLLRASLGPDQVLVAIVFQPQIASGRRTPLAALAESYDVIAPMSYWHARPITYRYQDAYSYVAESVRLVRQLARRPDLPVAVLGQTFDWFSRNEIGPGNPSGEEVRGALQAARDTGTLGIGFFNWFSTTPDEWDALQAFAW